MRQHKLKIPAELQIFITNNISSLLASKHRKMMGSNEITGEKLHEYQSEEDTDVDSKLAPSAIVPFWKDDSILTKKTV